MNPLKASSLTSLDSTFRRCAFSGIGDDKWTYQASYGDTRRKGFVKAPDKQRTRRGALEAVCSGHIAHHCQRHTRGPQLLQSQLDDKHEGPIWWVSQDGWWNRISNGNRLLKLCFLFQKPSKSGANTVSLWACVRTYVDAHRTWC